MSIRCSAGSAASGEQLFVVGQDAVRTPCDSHPIVAHRLAHMLSRSAKELVPHEMRHVDGCCE